VTSPEGPNPAAPASTTPRRHAAGSVAELLTGVTAREQLATGDSKSGAPLERVIINGERFVLKRLAAEEDWIARATGDHTPGRPAVMWRSGLLDRLPDCVEHTIVGCADDPVEGAALLMRDVTEWLVPAGDDPIPQPQHQRFLDHMAALHAAFWGYRDEAGLLPMRRRLRYLSPVTAEAEIARGGTHPVPTSLIPQGWRRLPTAALRSGPLAVRLVEDPTPLLAALAGTPTTLVHGDWKCGNLGTDARGRTILLDWAVPGEAPACMDLAWYLAINAARLPESKEDAIEAYRQALQGRGIDTGGWFPRQLGLCLIGAFLLLGWEKTFGDPVELDWWDRQVEEAARWLL
jgi:hypothetical protein